MAFACVLMISFSSSYINTAKHTLAVFFAITLIYSESWLPPVSTFASNLELLSEFSIDYLFNLTGRFIDTSMVFAIMIATTAYAYFSKWVRFTTFSLLELIIIPTYNQFSAIQDKQIVQTSVQNKSNEVE